MGAVGRLVDYFVVCGLDIDSGLEPDRLSGDTLHCSPLDRPYKGKVLAHYPERVATNPFDEHAVCMLCLPAGLLFRTQKHTLDPQFHSFVITREDASRHYGFSLVFYEEVRNRNICSAMHTLQAMHITELSSGQTPPGCRKAVPKETCRSLPRSFKLSPHVSGAAVSYYDIAKDKLFVAKSIGLICQHAYVKVAHQFLLNLYKSLPRQPGPGLSPEAYVHNLLYRVTLPSPGQSLRFYLPPTEPHLPPVPTVIYRPSLHDELPFFDYSIRELFVLLGVECVVQLFTCVLLENQVLLRSSDYNKLMLVAECIIGLLFPFCWPHVYVPILPSPLHHFLDAPVPFVMGLHTDAAYMGTTGSSMSKSMVVGTEAALCLVDIDKPNIQLPEELPIFPYKMAFIEELCQLLDKFQITRPDMDNAKYHLPINGLVQKFPYHDPMTSSCTLPGGGSRRKHSYNDILDWDETRPLNSSPPSSPTHMMYHNPHHAYHSNRITPPRSDALQRIVDIVRRTESIKNSTGVNLDDLEAEAVKPTSKRKKLTDEEQYQEDIRFNNAVREMFLNRFVHMFSAYEHFVILPDQDRDSWLSARESMQNFDKAAFLSDQPEQHRSFLSRFLESQMFATLIDNKIMSSWGEIDLNLELLDSRIKMLKKRHGGDSLSIRPTCYEPCLVKNFFQIDVKGDIDELLPPEEIHPHRAAYYRAFPLLDAKVMESQPTPSGESKTNSLRRSKPPKWQSKDITVESMGSDVSRKLSTESTPNAIAQNNKTFVEKLLKDCKSKTKKMLLEKMGTEAIDLGLGVEVSIVGVEENTMIASLCDLLERIWSHGLQHKFGKSALWMHLTNFQELEQCHDTSKPIDPNLVTPDLNSVAAENEISSQPRPSPNRSRDSSRASSRDSSRDRLSSGSNTLERKQQPVIPLRPLPESLTFDMRNIQAMSDIKTEIGYARAWVRLSLEKKLLSKHLKTLLSDVALLKSQYKRTAFLRCEEEREQFLYHLLTLNAVDYHCFTNTYPMTKLPYRVVIVPSRKASATTANCWVAVSGTNGETQQIPIPRNTLEFVFHHKNLGILTTLRIGHDNSGLSPRWMLENVFVRNEVTGHAYRFPCNRWLGRGVDDGSTERLLVAQSVSGRNPGGVAGVTNTLGRYGPEQAGPSRSTPASPAVPATTHLSPSTVQHMIGDCVNAIVKWHYRSKREKDVNSLSVLLCGENGLVKCLEQAFLCGFKSSRLFGRNLFIWDYFVRVKEVFEQNLSEECVDSSSDTSSGVYSYRAPSPVNPRAQEHSTIWRCYCHLMEEINNAGRTLGKDGKFQLFICLSLREHWLHRMLVPMSMTRVTAEMYEEQSFLRKRGLLTFLRQILEPLDEFNIVLENSITQGISSHV